MTLRSAEEWADIVTSEDGSIIDAVRAIQRDALKAAAVAVRETMDAIPDHTDCGQVQAIESLIPKDQP